MRHILFTICQWGQIYVWSLKKQECCWRFSANQNPCAGKASIKSVICDYYNVTDKENFAIRRGILREFCDLIIFLMHTVCVEPLKRIGGKFGMIRYSLAGSDAGNLKNEKNC